MMHSLVLLAAMGGGPWSNAGWSGDAPASPSPMVLQPMDPIAIHVPDVRAIQPLGPVRRNAVADPGGPPASAAEPGWPEDRQAARVLALAALNERRQQRGVSPVALDEKLTAAAQEHAEAIGSGSPWPHPWPHQGFPERVRTRGWTFRDCGIRNRGFGNVSEGIAWGGESPEEGILILDGASDPHEGHRADFEDPAFTHVGIGIAPHHLYGHVVVVDYGAQCARLTPPPIPDRPTAPPAAQPARTPVGAPASRPAATLPLQPQPPPRRSPYPQPATLPIYRH
jgi:uncharacterized protein YkwD